MFLHEIDCFICICKTEFCYICGKIWKNCNCPQFHDGYFAELRDDADALANWVGVSNLPDYRRRTVFRAERASERYAKHLRQTWGRPDPHSREEQFKKCAMKWRTDATMAIGISFGQQEISQDTISFTKTLATSLSTDVSFSRLSLAGHATATCLLHIDGRRKRRRGSSRWNRSFQQAHNYCQS